MELPDLKSLLKLLAPQYVAVVALAAGIALFVPDAALARLGLEAFKEAVHPWLGAAFVLSCCALLVHGTRGAWRWAVGRHRVRTFWRARYRRLHALAADEQELLQVFVRAQARSLKLELTDGAVGSLEAAGVIRKSAPVGVLSGVGGWAYKIQPWAYQYLVEHPELLGFGFQDNLLGPEEI